MEILSTEERVMTELDHGRIKRLIHHTTPGAHPMRDTLDMADVVPSRQVPDDVVTMYSRVRLTALDSGQPLVLTLCYPADADIERGFVSVLSPVGTSMLGLRVGEVARWRLPGGWEGMARVEALEFQPEAQGVYTL